MMDTPSLDLLKDIARGAGDILRNEYGKEHNVEHKGVIDLVTEVDRKAEAYILGRIRQRFASHSIVTEESGRLAGNKEYRWYIDPLDGTNNYAHNLPIFCVSIAYEEAGIIQMGVIYDPLLDECFSAERGGGFWLNDRRVTISGTTELINSLLVTGFPYDIQTSKNNNLENFSKFLLRTQGVRRLGSAALDIAYVAAGRFDGYWEIGIQPWDIAAGTVMVEEAGGLITGLDGDPNYMQPPYAIIAANPVLHAKILETLKDGKL